MCHKRTTTCRQITATLSPLRRPSAGVPQKRYDHVESRWGRRRWQRNTEVGWQFFVPAHIDIRWPTWSNVPDRFEPQHRRTWLSSAIKPSIAAPPTRSISGGSKNSTIHGSWWTVELRGPRNHNTTEGTAYHLDLVGIKAESQNQFMYMDL